MADGAQSVAGELTLWGRLDAYNVPKVVWAAEEVGRAYSRIDAGHVYGVVDSPAYRAMNPNGRVPCMKDGDFVLWESNVIVRYLCARYAPGRLCPNDLLARMELEKWMDWEATDAYRAFGPVYNVILRKTDRFTPEQAAEALVRTAWKLEVLDEHLARNAYVGGEAFSMGDIPIGILADFFFRAGPDFDGLLHVRRWHAALIARPAMRAAMMVEWTNAG